MIITALLLSIALLAQGNAQVSRQAGTISGRIVRTTGTPAEGVRVLALLAPDNAAQALDVSVMSLAQTDASGRYLLENVPPGRYYLMVGALDTPSYYPGVTSRTSATVVTVTPGATLSGLDFVVPTIVRVSGRVTWEDGARPVASAGPPTVWAAILVRLSTDGRITALSALGADGSFTFLNLPAGRYQVSVGGVGYEGLPVDLVVDNDVSDLQIVAPVLVPVSGAVTLASRGLQPQMQLTFTRVAKTGVGPATTIVQAFHAFQLQLPRGEYRVSVGNLPEGYLLRSVRSGTTDLMTLPLSVNNAQPPTINIELGVTSPPPWVSISGRLVGWEGLPAVNSVQLTGPEPNSLFTAEVTGGSFTIPMAPPGYYSLVMQPSVQAALSVVVGKSDLSLEIPPPRQIQVSGRALDEKGLPLQSSVAFTFTPVPATNGWTTQLPLTTQTGRPADDGTFELPLTEGAYRVTARSGSMSTVSLTHGNVNLMTNPMVATSAVRGELRVVFRSAPAGAAPATGREAPPEILTRVQPTYTEQARSAKLEGIVPLIIKVRKDGSVDPDIRVLSPLGLGLDEQAVASVRQWKFKPGTNNAGIPVDAFLPIELQFQLK